MLAGTPKNLAAPDGIRLVFQPAHSPELQPAEHLWPFVDEPLANRCFATIESLDQAVGDRCVALPSSKTLSETARCSTGGHVSERGTDQPEMVSVAGIEASTGHAYTVSSTINPKLQRTVEEALQGGSFAAIRAQRRARSVQGP